jgi:hypothetical protein
VETDYHQMFDAHVKMEEPEPFQYFQRANNPSANFGGPIYPGNAQGSDWILIDSPTSSSQVAPDIIIKNSPESSPVLPKRGHARVPSNISELSFTDDEGNSPLSTPTHSRRSSGVDEILEYIEWNPSHTEKPAHQKRYISFFLSKLILSQQARDKYHQGIPTRETQDCGKEEKKRHE